MRYSGLMQNARSTLTSHFFFFVVGAYFLIAGLRAAAGILIPITFSALLAYLLHPVVSWLEDRKFPPALAVALTLFIAGVVALSIAILISAQLESLLADVPVLQERIFEKMNRAQSAISFGLGVDPASQVSWLKARAADLLTFDTAAVQSVFRATTGVFSALVLIPIYTFFLLLYRDFFRRGFLGLFSANRADAINDTLHEIQRVIRQYLAGLLIVIYVVAVLNMIGLVAIGMEHALFFGALAALLTVIPYIGIIVGSAIPAFVAFFTHDSLLMPLGIIGVFTLVQLLEDNFITPNIVGHKMRLNPPVAILAVIMGGYIWGIWGMMVSIPVAAAMKIAFDHVEELKPIGTMMGLRETR